MFNLVPSAGQDVLDQGDAGTGTPPPETPAQSFSAAFDASTHYSNTLSYLNNMGDALQDHLDAYKAATGETVPNPYRPSFNPLNFDPRSFNDKMADTRAKVGAGAERLDDASLALPDDDTIYREGIAKGRAALARQATMAGGQQNLGSGIAGWLGGLAGQFTDPIDLGLNAAAIATLPEGGSLIPSLLRSAATFGGQQAVEEALTGAYKTQVNPDYGPGEAVGNIVAAGVGGAALEGGSRALGGLWRTLRGKAPDIAAAIPQDIQDAGNVAERAADLDAQNPFKGGDTEGAHSEAIVNIERDLVNDREPQLPAAAEVEGSTPTGSVFTPTPEVAEYPPITAGKNVFVGAQAIPVKYGLAEAADLVTSHDADFRVNPDYPADLQPRDRAGKPAQEQVMQMAQNLEPERLGPNVEANSGAPIVGPDNVVESGNGRAMAVRQAYANGDDGAYRAFLERSGYDPSGMKAPVLVGRRVSAMSDDERAAFAHAANGSASLRMSATEQAISDARHIGPDIAHLLKPGDVAGAANRDFVRALAAKMPAGERGGMLTRDGSLSQNGIRRVRAAMTARAYGDPAFIARVFDHPEVDIKTVANSLVDAAADWIKMRDAVTRGDIKPGQDITDDVMQSVRAILRAKDEGRTVGEILNQSDMFASDTSQLAARLFFKDASYKRYLSKADMTANLSTFARDLTSRGSGRDLFGEEAPGAAEVLKGTIRRSDAATSAMVADSNSPKAIEAAFTDPKVAIAAEADLNRQIAQGKNRVPVANADGSVELGFADKELHDLDQQLNLAKEVEACSAPAQEAAE